MKISLLPAPIREQINHRLDTGEPDAPLLAWLQSLPEVLALNAASYDGHPLNQDDLAAWKLSRFRQLRLCATALQAVQSLLPHAAQIQQAAPASLTDQLAACLASAVAAAWFRPASNEDDSAVLLQRLQELARIFHRPVSI
jgi:restriction endonuclease Mrr